MSGIMKGKAGIDEWPTKSDESVVVDVMWCIRLRPPLHNDESENYARRIFDSITSSPPSQNIDLMLTDVRVYMGLKTLITDK